MIFFIFNVLFFGAITYYFYAVRRQQITEDQLLHDKRKLLGHEIAVEKKELKDIGKDAVKKSEMVIGQSEELAKEIIHEFEVVFNRNSESPDLLVLDKNMLDTNLNILIPKIKEQYAKKIESLLSDLDQYRAQKAEHIVEVSTQHEEISSHAIEQMKITSWQKIKEEIEEYKNTQEMEITQKVQDVVNIAAKDLLGHSLTKQEHEELIIKAIKKAMEKGNEL